MILFKRAVCIWWFLSAFREYPVVACYFYNMRRFPTIHVAKLIFGANILFQHTRLLMSTQNSDDDNRQAEGCVLERKISQHD